VRRALLELARVLLLWSLVVLLAFAAGIGVGLWIRRDRATHVHVLAL